MSARRYGLRAGAGRWLLVGYGVALVVAGGTAGRASGPESSVVVESHPLTVDSRMCSGSFVAHRLPHVTTSAKDRIGLYQGHGAGVALADLNDDDLIDIVLAGHSAPTTVLWNRGKLSFRSERLDTDASRAVNALDVDGDGRVDLVFTHSGDRPSFWRASGNALQPAFVPVEGKRFIGRYNAYAMAWGDLDGDGDLDMVGGSYNAELTALGLGTPVGGGVFVYTNDHGALEASLLSSHAQALTILLSDLDADGRLDILVGNDFASPDNAFLNRSEGWLEASLFQRTTANTMGFAEGDTDNDGSYEIMATDMRPYRRDAETNAIWEPALEGSKSMQPNDGLQFVANALQFRGRGADSVFEERAGEMGVDATGWSWSVQFGDLDNDGALDLYVVNGMISSSLFGHLPGNELVEENQALRNDGTGHFVPASEWGLGATESGRGMSLADLDNDGDLDAVVNNLAKPAVLFENRLCSGAALEVELDWEGSPNARAIGADLRLHSSRGVWSRQMRVSSGYLSSVPARVHFGLGNATSDELLYLEVTWPDGKVSLIEQPPLGTLLKVRRTLPAR